MFSRRSTSKVRSRLDKRRWCSNSRNQRQFWMLLWKLAVWFRDFATFFNQVNWHKILETVHANFLAAFNWTKFCHGKSPSSRVKIISSWVLGKLSNETLHVRLYLRGLCHPLWKCSWQIVCYMTLWWWNSPRKLFWFIGSTQNYRRIDWVFNKGL